MDQSVQTTRERVASGQAFVALSTTGELVGTVTVAPPKQPDGRYLGDPVPACYTQADTAMRPAQQALEDARVANEKADRMFPRGLRK